MDRTMTIEIPAPKFSFCQLGTFHWNNQEQSIRIAQRWFSIDESDQGNWWYRGTGDKEFFPESVFAPDRSFLKEDTMTIEIPVPKFSLFQLITLNWNNQEQHTSIVQRWLNIDESDQGGWWYKVAEDEQLYPESVFAPRDD